MKVLVCASLLFLLFSHGLLDARQERASSYKRPELVNRSRIARGLLFTTHRHTKTIRDYSRLSNLVRSYPSTILIHTFRINPRFFDIRVLDSADYFSSRASVRRLVEESGALGAVNAGFFDENSRPLGLHIKRKQVIRGFTMASKKSAAVFYERDGLYKIISNKNYKKYFIESKPPSPMTEAVQSYPLLVGRGKSMWKWRPGEGIAARTAVGISWTGLVYLVVSDTDPLNGLSLSELASFMAVTHRCKVALNLDGGNSSQMYYNDSEHTISVEGRDTIRTALAFFHEGEGYKANERSTSTVLTSSSE